MNEFKTNLTDTILDKSKDQSILLLSLNDHNMNEEAARWWDHIDNGSDDFSSKVNIIKECSKLKPDSIIEYWNKYIRAVSFMLQLLNVF